MLDQIFSEYFEYGNMVHNMVHDGELMYHGDNVFFMWNLPIKVTNIKLFMYLSVVLKRQIML